MQPHCMSDLSKEGKCHRDLRGENGSCPIPAQSYITVVVLLFQVDQTESVDSKCLFSWNSDTEALLPSAI